MSLKELRAWLNRPVVPVGYVPYMGLEILKLLDIVEKLADSEPVQEVENWSVCYVCGGGFNLAWTAEKQHREDCAWLGARKLAGET